MVRHRRTPNLAYWQPSREPPRTSARELRTQAGRTQAEVAAVAGFDGPYLSRAEGGERDFEMVHDPPLPRCDWRRPPSALADAITAAEESDDANRTGKH